MLEFGVERNTHWNTFSGTHLQTISVFHNFRHKIASPTDVIQNRSCDWWFLHLVSGQRGALVWRIYDLASVLVKDWGVQWVLAILLHAYCILLISQTCTTCCFSLFLEMLQVVRSIAEVMKQQHPEMHVKKNYYFYVYLSVDLYLWFPKVLIWI